MKIKSFFLFFSLFLFTGIYAQQLPKDQMWVNARDYGASGSQSETVVTTTAGSNQITVTDPADFRVGQGVMISKCDPHYSNKQLRGLRGMYRVEETPFEDVIELRGFDGSGGDWLVFVIDIRSDNPYTFRWSDDLARSWKVRCTGHLGLAETQRRHGNQIQETRYETGPCDQLHCSHAVAHYN